MTTPEDDLSMDARCLLSSWWLSPRCEVAVGGKSAKSILTDRAISALAELEAAGYIRSEPIGDEGRRRFIGTGKKGQRLRLVEMEEHGAWSPTMPNPDAPEEAKSQTTMSLHFRAGGQQ